MAEDPKAAAYRAVRDQTAIKDIALATLLVAHVKAYIAATHTDDKEKLLVQQLLKSEEVALAASGTIDRKVAVRWVRPTPQFTIAIAATNPPSALLTDISSHNNSVMQAAIAYRKA